MTRRDPMLSDDDRLAERLADYQAQLEAGDTGAGADSDDAEGELAQRLERGQHCLKLLDQMRRQLKPDAEATVVEERASRAPRVRHVGRFEVISELGVGGFGIVYRAWDPHTQREVALKVPRMEALASAQHQARFEQEAHASARLDHSNIVAVLEAGIADGLPFIASVYYAAPNLATWLAKNRLTPRAAATLVWQLADAVDHAHQRGVLHRDIKPSNILMAPVLRTSSPDDPGAMPKLMDFGMAKLLDSTRHMTQTGAMLGTIRYMSPEQAMGRVREIGPWSDVYSLGAVLYELLSGEAPFASHSDFEALKKIESDEPSRLRTSRRNVPVDLETICLRCLEKEPTRRYPSAAALADDLRRFLDGRPVKAKASSWTERARKWTRRNPAWAALFAGAFVAMWAAIGLLAWSNYRISHALRLVESQRIRALGSESIAREREFAARELAYDSDMRLAQEAWASSNSQEAIDLLARYIPQPGEPDLRGLEWRYLWETFHRDSEIVARSDGPFWAIAATPDETGFVTGDREGRIQLRQLDPPRLEREFIGHAPGDINRLLFTSDGKTLISAGNDHTIRIWDVETGEARHVLKAHDDWVGAIALSLDERFLVSGGGDGRVLRHDLETLRAEELYRHPGAVRWIAFYPDPSVRYFASGCELGQVKTWDYDRAQFPEGLPEGRLKTTEDCRFRDGVFTRSGWLFASSRGNLLRWGTNLGRMPPVELQSKNVDSTLSLCAIDDWVIHGGSDSMPNIWARDWTNGLVVRREFKGHAEAIRGLAPLKRSGAFLSCSEDGTCRRWQLEAVDPTARRWPVATQSVAWSRAGSTLFFASKDHRILALDPASAAKPREILSFPDPAWELCATSDGARLLLVDTAGWARSYDSATGERLCEMQVPIDSRIAISGDGSTWARYHELELVVYDLTTFEPLWTYRHPFNINGMKMVGDQIAIHCGDGSLLSFHIRDGRRLAQTAQRGTIASLDSTEDGTELVTVSDDRVLTIRDGRSLEAKQRFSLGANLRHVFYADHDRRILVTTEESVLLVNPRTGQTVLRAAPLPNDLWAVATDDGLLLASPGGEVVVLNLRFEDGDENESATDGSSISPANASN